METTIQEHAALIALLLNSLSRQVEDESLDLSDEHSPELALAFAAVAAIHDSPLMSIPTRLRHIRRDESNKLLTNLTFNFVLDCDGTLRFPEPVDRLFTSNVHAR